MAIIETRTLRDRLSNLTAYQLKPNRQRKTAKRDATNRAQLNNGAFALLDLIISLSIMAILMSLLLPAVVSVRESSRAVGCKSNIRQLSMGMGMLEVVHRVLPSNGGFDSSCTIEGSNGLQVYIGTDDLEAGRSYRWGIGQPRLPIRPQTGSWSFSILPYLEQKHAYDLVLFSSRQTLFLCSSRSRSEPQIPVSDAHGNYHSGGYAWAQTDYAANKNICPNEFKVIRLANIRDGASNTILLGEKAYCLSVQGPYSWYWDEPIFSGGSDGTARVGANLFRDSRENPFKGCWGSSHPGGVMFSFADGRVQQLSFEMSTEILEAALSLANGEVFSID